MIKLSLPLLTNPLDLNYFIVGSKLNLDYKYLGSDKNNYHIKFDVDLQYCNVVNFYFALVKDNKEYFFDLDLLSILPITSILKYHSFLLNGVDTDLNLLFDDVSSLSDDLDDVTDNITDLKDNLGDYYNTLKNNIGSIKCDVDLTSVTTKLNDIDGKINLLQVLDISKVIDDKISNLLALQSLNGSNGSKFVDGSIVNVQGYDGSWVVEGSYPMLNADNVTIIVYKLKQNNMVLLAPAPFVKKVS